MDQSQLETGSTIQTPGRPGAWTKLRPGSKLGIGIGLGSVLLAAIGGIAFAGSDGGSRELRAVLTDLVQFAGGEPERCVFAGPDRQICRWEMEGRLLTGDSSQNSSKDSHRDSNNASSSNRVHLICETRIGEAAPGADDGACSVYPVLAEEIRSADATGTTARRDTAQRLVEARTVTELSDLVGDIPDDCATGTGTQLCQWRLDESTIGRLQLQQLAETVAPVHLRCELPLDGEPRAVGSCGMVADEQGRMIGVNSPILDEFEREELLSADAR